MFCLSDERDNGHSPVYRAVMILPLLQVLMRVMLFAYRRKVRDIPFYTGRGFHASKFHGVSMRYSDLIGPRGNVLARKGILTNLQPL
jgi:hypothetical protein